jgi:hypothetical protein
MLWDANEEAKAVADVRAKYAGRVVAIECYYHDGLCDYGTKVLDDNGNIVDGPGFMDSCRLVVDAPASIVNAYNAEVAAKARAAREAAAKAKAEREAAEELVTVRRGKVVKVVRGRKIPKGTLGACFWVGESKYGWRVGIELADGSREFTALCNVEVVNDLAKAA